MVRLYCVLIGYAFGLIQSAYIFGKMKGVDIRTVGSGNAGSTNTLRTFGTKAGLTVLFFDVLKTMAAIWLVRLTFGKTNPQMLATLIYYTATGVILGHNFPFYLGFKGGKGIAATLGFMLSINSPIFFCTMFPFFCVIYFLTHYISLGSMLVYILFAAETYILGSKGMLGDITSMQLIELETVALFLMALAIFQHRSNLVKLIKGVENKTYLTKKGKAKYLASKQEASNEG